MFGANRSRRNRPDARPHPHPPCIHRLHTNRPRTRHTARILAAHHPHSCAHPPRRAHRAPSHALTANYPRSQYHPHPPSLARRSLPAVPPAPARLPAEVWKPQTFSFYQSISNLDVSLPNVSKKDVKGLLFRKQPLHTSPNRSKKGEAGDSRLSFLRNLSSPPRFVPASAGSK